MHYFAHQLRKAVCAINLYTSTRCTWASWANAAEQQHQTVSRRAGRRQKAPPAKQAGILFSTCKRAERIAGPRVIKHAQMKEQCR